MVNNVLNDGKETIGSALKDYLGLTPKSKKHDLRKDRFQLEQLSNPEFLPSSRWPVGNKLALSIAQQVERVGQMDSVPSRQRLRSRVPSHLPNADSHRPCSEAGISVLYS